MTLIARKSSEFTADCAILDQSDKYMSTSAPQRKDITRLEILIEQAVKRMSHENLLPPQNRRWPAVCVDRGCGDGDHATILTDAFAQAIQIWSQGPVQTIHNDRVEIDLRRLARHINGVRPETNRYTSQTEQSRTHAAYPLISAGSFLDPLMPDNSVHMVVSNAALHWLDLGHVAGEAYRNDEASLQEIAHSQWEMFLRTVSRELVPGGRLVISQIGAASASLREQHVPVRLVRLAAARIRRQLGFSESPNCPDWQVLPVYLRTRDEVLRPPRNKENLLSLSTELCEAENVDCPCFAAWRQHGCHRSFAASFTNFIRAFSEWSVHSWLKQLVNDTDSHYQVSQLLDEFYQIIEQELRHSPEDWEMRRTRIVLVACRTD